MKRFVGIVVVLALAGLYSACSSSKSTADQDIVIGDISHDTSADVKDTGKDTVTDTARDTPATEGIVEDTQGVDNPPPPDNGVDTPIVTDVPVGTDVPVTTDTIGCNDDSVGSCKAVYACENDCNADATGDACRQEFTVRDYDFHCPGCGGWCATCAGGDELALTFLELEEDGDDSARAQSPR